MNPKHHISVQPETRHNDGDEGPLVFRFIPKEKTSPDGWKAICGAFIPDNAKTIHGGGTVKKLRTAERHTIKRHMPLVRPGPATGRRPAGRAPLDIQVQDRDRFITELTIINKLGKEQQ